MTHLPRPAARLTSIHQFAAHLRQAMHDIGHEDADGIALIHFWDDDSLFLPIRGFPVLVDDPNQEDRDLLAQTLFAAGFLGRVMLTAPHRNELFGQFSSWQRSSVAQGDRRARANFLRRRELNDVRALIEFISKNAPLDEDAAAQALVMLRELDPISFVYTQALAGDWHQRLRDLAQGRGLIDLEVVGPDTGEVLDRGDLFEGFAARISLRRRGERALATAIDAAALTSVAIMNQAAQHGDSPIYPRFFTSSPTIKAVLTDPWARDQLSFAYHDDANVAHSTPVWRDSYYYVLRSIFPGLRLALPGMAADRSGIDTLSQLSRNLDSALRSGARDAFDYVDTASFREDLSLSQVIDDLERSRMSRIWLSSPPRAVRGMLESLQSLLLADAEFALVDSFETLLQGRFNMHLEERRIAGEIRLALEHAPALLGTGERTRLSLNHDFAVVRWGLEFESDRDVLELERGASVALHELLELDDVGRMRRSQGAATRLLAILFGLEQFDLAREFLADLDIPDEGPEISFMRFIASLMAPGGLSENDLDVIVAFVEQVWEGLDEREQVRFALAYGYALFAAWDRSSFGGVLPSRIQDEKGWARRAVQAVVSRLDLMSEWPRAFGLNHVVYVATRAGLDVAELPSLARDLSSIAEKTEDFRFLDTVGLYLTHQALLLSPDDELESAQARKLVKRALSHLRKAVRLVPEDREVEGHLEIVQEAQRRYAPAPR